MSDLNLEIQCMLESGASVGDTAWALNVPVEWVQKADCFYTRDFDYWYDEHYELDME